MSDDKTSQTVKNIIDKFEKKKDVSEPVSAVDQILNKIANPPIPKALTPEEITAEKFAKSPLGKVR